MGKEIFIQLLVIILVGLLFYLIYIIGFISKERSSLKSQIKIKNEDIKHLKNNYDLEKKKTTKLEFDYRESIKSIWLNYYLNCFPSKWQKGYENDSLIITDVKLKAEFLSGKLEKKKTPLDLIPWINLFKNRQLNIPVILHNLEIGDINYFYQYTIFNKTSKLTEIVDEEFINKTITE